MIMMSNCFFEGVSIANSETARNLSEIEYHNALPSGESTGKLDIQKGGNSQMEPVVSFDYFSKQFENPLASKTHHLISAHTGIKFSLFENLDMTGTAKLPFLTAETISNELTPVGRATEQTSFKGDLGSNTLQNIGWHGDLNIKIGNRLNLNLFYDYTKKVPGLAGENLQDEKIGSKIEIKFR